VSHLAFVFVCLVWGSTFIFLERVTHAFGPVTIGIGRLLCGATALGVLWFLRRRDYRLRPADWVHIVFIALAFNALPHIVMPYVLGNGFGHSFFGPMVAPIPLITILVSIPMLGLWPTKRQLLGVLGGLACLWLIVDDGFHRGMGVGFLALAFIIPLTSAVGSTYIKWKLSHVPVVPLTAAFLAVAGLSLVPLEFFPHLLASWHLAPPAAAVPSLSALLLLVALGAIGTGVSTAVFVWMIHKEGPLFAGMTTYVVPVLALAWGLLDHETITPHQLAAIAGILAMVTLVQFDPARSKQLRRFALGTLPSTVEPVIMTAESAVSPLVVPASALETVDPPPVSPHQAA
jgi:drug/metabolite transporter (DMT)-like permease